jgi:hypothetical protein
LAKTIKELRTVPGFPHTLILHCEVLEGSFSIYQIPFGRGRHGKKGTKIEFLQNEYQRDHRSCYMLKTSLDINYPPSATR